MFETQNPNIPGINVFSINDQNKIYPLRLPGKDCQRSIGLFLYDKKKKGNITLSSKISEDYLTHTYLINNTKKFYCKNVLMLLALGNYLINTPHIVLIMIQLQSQCQRKTRINFENHHKKLLLPFVAYADFQCSTKPMNNCEPD